MNRVLARKRVGLALGGGAARGLAHVGVLQMLEQEGTPVDCIAGTSVGALVGAAYAAGLHGAQLAEIAHQVRWRKLARPVWPRQGLFSFDRLERYFVETVGDLTFAELDIPYAAVATDLETGRPVVLREGRVAPAVRASCSVPGLVTPVEWEGRLLTDGGVSNNLPISVVRELGADVVVAVDLMSPLRHRPKNLVEIAGTAICYLIARAGDDPDSADVYIAVPLWGLGSLLRLSAGNWLSAVGREAAVRAMSALQAVALAPNPSPQGERVPTAGQRVRGTNARENEIARRSHHSGP